MDLWKYYDGDLKYPDITKHSRKKEIAKANPKWAYEYVSKHGEDKELEPILATSAYHSYWYAFLVLKGPFKLGEKNIAKDIEYSFMYANNVLNGPFPLGEKIIASNSYYSFVYSKLIKHRFELGEPSIAMDEYYSEKYTNEVLKKDFYLDGKLICKYEG